MDRREQIARIVDPRGFASRDLALQKEREWREKARDFPSSPQGDPSTYPRGQAAVDHIVREWDSMADTYAKRAVDVVKEAYEKADAIIALDK